MVSHYFSSIIFISLFNLILTQNVTTTTKTTAKFYCYIFEKNDSGIKSMPQEECPTRICIMFISPCQNYWATSCYNETHPMTLSKEFPKIKGYYPPLSFYPSYSICTKSFCNENPLKADKVEIMRDPNSFDNLLWPKMNKQINSKNKNKLQNQIPIELSSTFEFEFSGQTFNSSKKIWFEFEFMNGPYKFLKRYKLIFGMKNSTLVLIISDSTTSTLKILNPLNLKQKKFVPGQLMNIKLQSLTLLQNGIQYSNNYSLSINGEKVYNFAEDFYTFLDSINYGGKWVKTSIKPALDKNEMPRNIFPGFIRPEPKLREIIDDCDENSEPKVSLNYTNFVSRKKSTNTNVTYIFLGESLIEPNEMIEYDFRNNLCPNSGVLRIQIQSYQNISGIFNDIYIWNFYTPKWYPGTKETIKVKNCPQIGMLMSDSCWFIICRGSNNQEKLPKSIYDLKTFVTMTCNSLAYPSLQYLVQSPKRSYKC